MEFIAPIDAVFLIAESREQPMHVGSLQIFETPEDAGPDFVRNVYRKLLADKAVTPTFRKHPASFFGAPQLAWTRAQDVELEYHVRHLAVPAPGGRDQLVELANRLHTSLLDRHRPLWEISLISGLADGHFAVYAKMHHGLIDGVSAQRLIARTLTSDPRPEDIRAPWNLPRRQRVSEPISSKPVSSKPVTSNGGVRAAAGSLKSTVASGPKLLRAARTALASQQRALPFDAPRTMFNVPIGGARRSAVRSWSMERVKQVKKAAGCTLNDVVLAMSAGALREYLAERDALPDKPLIAMVPMSLRAGDDADDAPDGVKVGAALCNLGTDIADPLQRLTAVSESMRRSKEVYGALNSTQTMALSALMLSPLAVTLMPGLIPLTKPAFNIVISNVPGPREPMYWSGARLEASYPMSIPFDGQAVNITLTSNGSNLDFGVVGCRRSVPELPRILDHLDHALGELEHAADRL
ncbi:WS/DGAT/MGAT family O-acyltransferase [Nocardia callitridis]|uniref:Diacylglycerol O-acyltransferase n=1 Tax=Nocardia callitridis TaxID=648753 RepID=A0ABP9JZJ5_9NOCA